MEHPMTLKPLSGVRVLDFTFLPPGGACTVMLADLGADIIRVESPAQKGRPSMVIGQVPLSRGKRSITLDQRNPAANAILARLAASVDVVVENSMPGSMEARGFGYSHARAANPRLIWCAMTGFGQDGPNAAHAGHDMSYVAHSGMLGALSADMPWQPATMLSVPAGAQTAVIGIQAALLQRVASGEGAFLDISLSESMGWFLTCAINPFSDNPYMLLGTPDRRVYGCGDGRYIAVASAEPRTWGALCDGLGLPELKDRLHKADLAADTTAKLAQAFLACPAAEWVERLAPAGAAVTLVNRAKEVLDDPHIRARGSIVDCAGVPTPVNPVRLSTADGQKGEMALSPPHLVGQDNADVLTAAGFAAEEIEKLEAEGVI
jgi:crotonobetainyl-CoA:carnitine CoA-transferase CaiB-like acyl-CoA transferase